MYRLKTAAMKATKIPGVISIVRDPLAAEQQQKGDADGTKNIHERRTDRCGRDRTQIRAEQTAVRPCESGQSPSLHVEGLHDPVAGDGLVQNVLNFRQLVLSVARGVADAAADLPRRKYDDWHEEQQDPGELASEIIPPPAATERKVKNCCRNSASTLDMANCTRSMSLMMVESNVPVVCFWKKGGRAAQHGVVKIVAQVGDHAESGMVHQISAGIVEDPLQHGRGNER